jgi:hypothetical protein
MKTNIKYLIIFILLGIMCIASLGLCFYGFFNHGYSIVQSILFTLITCVIAELFAGLVYLTCWVFEYLFDKR